jgi:hypothetical protein
MPGFNSKAARSPKCRACGAVIRRVTTDTKAAEAAAPPD